MEGGRLVLSPTPCLMSAMSSSVNSEDRGVAEGIFIPGFFLRDSSNKRFCLAFKVTIPGELLLHRCRSSHDLGFSGA
jgi:hypothetical protein